VINTIAGAPVLQKLYRLISANPTLILLDQGVVSLASFASMAILGRSCGSEELGIYGIAFTMLWLLTSFSNSVIWIPFTMKVPMIKGHRRQRLQGSVLVHVACFLILIILPAACLTLYLGDRAFYNLIAFYVFFAGMILREHARRVSMALHQFKRLLLIDVPSSVLQVIALLMVSWSDHLSARVTMVCIGIISGIAFLISHLFDDAKMPSRKRAYLDFRRCWDLGKWLVGVSITGAFSELVIRFMIISLLGLSAQGRFTASFSLPNFANPVVITYTNYLRITMASRFATGGKRSVFLLLFRSVPVFLMISIGLFGAIAFFGEWAAAAVFGMQFADLGHLIAWNCLSALVSAMTLPLEAALLSLGRGKDLFLSSVGRIACTLCLGIPLIYGFELPGASILAAIGFLAVAIIQSVYLLRQFTTVQSTHSDDVEAEPIQ